MIIFIVILILCLVIILGFWLFGVYYQNNSFLPTRTINGFQKLLVVFPHPDDEVLGTGGLIQLFRKKGKEVVLYFPTKGEKGTPNAEFKEDLKMIRTVEANNAARILGVSRLVHQDLGDGQLSRKRKQLEEGLKEIISREKPDLLVTYDLSGMYGHPDHIACSELVTRLVKTKYHKVHLWYISQNPRTAHFVKLPEHMAQDPHFKMRKTSASFKVFIGGGVINKSKALYAHKSQYHSFRGVFPFKMIPVWFFVTQSFYEYFYEAN